MKSNTVPPVSAQPSAAAFRFEDLIVGAKPRHGAKPLLGKLLLPKLHRARREEFHHQNYHVFQFSCREGDEAKLNDCRGVIFYVINYFISLFTAHQIISTQDFFWGLWTVLFQLGCPSRSRE